MIELNKPNWNALPKKASLTAEDLTPHYTLTKISDNNYHFFNAETKMGQVLSTQEAIHKLAHLSGKLLSNDHIKAIESLASFDSMIVPTSATKITTTASAETMSVDPWKLIEINGTKYFVRNTEEAEAIEKHAADAGSMDINKQVRDQKIAKRTAIIKELVDNFNNEHPDALSMDNTSNTNKVDVYGTLENLSVIENQLKDQGIYSSIMPNPSDPEKHILTVIHFPFKNNDVDTDKTFAQASKKGGINVTASAHKHAHLYTVVAHTRGITESGLVVKACDCCCQGETEPYKHINVNFDLNEPEKVSFNMTYEGTKDELLAFIQEQVQKLGVMLPNTAFDVSTSNCTCPMCAQQGQQALFILETPETAKVSASTSLDTLKTYAAAHYKEYSIKDKNLNVVASHMDNIKKEATFAESLSDMLISNHNVNTTVGDLSETKASVTGNIFKKAKSPYVGVDAYELDDALAYIEQAVSAIRNNNNNNKPPLSAKELLNYCAVVLKAGNKNEKAYAKSVYTYVKEHPEEFLAVPDADDNLSDVNDLINSVPSTKSGVSSVFEEEPLRSLISLDQLSSDVYQKMFAPNTTLELLNEAKDNLSNFLSIVDSSYLPVDQYHKAKMSLTSLLETCEFKIKELKENSFNTKGSSYTNQETGETKEMPTEVEEKLNPTKEPIMTVKTNGKEEEWWKNN